MKRINHSLTPEQRALIYGYFKGGAHSYQETADAFPSLQLSKGGIWKAINSIDFRIQNHEDPFHDKSRTGRPREFPEQSKEILIETLKSGRKINNAQQEIQNQTGLLFSDTTLSNYAKEAGLVFQKPKIIKKVLSSENKAERLNYCNMIKTLDRMKIIWVDESAFPLQRMTGNGTWMSKSSPITKIEKPYNPFLHLWGAICYSGKSPLKFLKGKETWNGDTLIETYNGQFFEFQKNFFPDDKYYFVQDNAKPHVAGKFKEYIETRIPIIIKYPPYSPDLNPIEKIWGNLKNKVKLYNQ